MNFFENIQSDKIYELLIKNINSYKFLSFNASKENILKEIIIPDMYLFKEKLTELCKKKQENLLYRFKESIL